jgi:hypothetical protein
MTNEKKDANWTRPGDMADVLRGIMFFGMDMRRPWEHKAYSVAWIRK